MSPLWLARKEPYFLSQPIGHDKVPDDFLGSDEWTRGCKEKRKVASLRDIEGLYATQPSDFIFLCGLDPDGCLEADQLRIRSQTV